MALSLLPLLLCCQPKAADNYVEQLDGGLWLDGNQYYQYVFSLVDSEPAVSGCNFWAWGGEARPRHEQWQVGDPYMGDPAQEQQGMNSVFDCDTTTLEIVKASHAYLR